jgi:hypothetical protein
MEKILQQIAWTVIVGLEIIALTRFEFKLEDAIKGLSKRIQEGNRSA